MGDTWYYSSAGKAVGPHSLADIQQMVQSGRLGPNDHVCGDGKTWRRVSEVPDLAFATSTASVATATAAGTTGIVGYSGHGGTVTVSERAMESFRRTVVWTRLVAIFFFVGAGICLIFSVLIAVVGAAGGFRAPMGRGPIAVDNSPVIAAIAYLIVSALYGAAGALILRYSMKCSALVSRRRELELEQAIDAQRLFWKCWGILMIVCVALAILLFCGGFIAGVMLAASRR